MNPLPKFRAPVRRSRRRLLAVLALALGGGDGTPRQRAAPPRKSRATRSSSAEPRAQLAGEAIRALLLRGVKLADLVLVTRTPEKLASFSTNGAAVRLGDFDKPETLEPAFAGGRQLLLVSTNSDGDRVAQHTNAISAARRAGIRHIVYTSFINATADNPALVARAHQLTEEALMRSGVQYTILRNQLYMDGLVDEAAQALKTGDLYTNGARGKWAPVARRDCGEAAAGRADHTGARRQDLRDHRARADQSSGSREAHHRRHGPARARDRSRRRDVHGPRAADRAARSAREAPGELRRGAARELAEHPQRSAADTAGSQAEVGARPATSNTRSRLLSANPQLRAN